MVVDRSHREEEPFGDHAARLPGGGERGDLTFAVGEWHDGGGTGKGRCDGPLSKGNQLTGALVERSRAALLAVAPARISGGRHRFGGEQVRAQLFEALARGREVPRVAG